MTDEPTALQIAQDRAKGWADRLPDFSKRVAAPEVATTETPDEQEDKPKGFQVGTSRLVAAPCRDDTPEETAAAAARLGYAGDAPIAAAKKERKTRSDFREPKARRRATTPPEAQEAPPAPVLAPDDAQAADAPSNAPEPAYTPLSEQTEVLAGLTHGAPTPAQPFADCVRRAPARSASSAPVLPKIGNVTYTCQKCGVKGNPTLTCRNCKFEELQEQGFTTEKIYHAPWNRRPDPPRSSDDLKLFKLNDFAADQETT